MSTAADRSRAVRRILWLVLALNLAVTLIKLLVGLASGALSVVADAFHSLVDSSSNIVGLVGVWAGARPADDNHPYGHHKYETVAAMAIGGMLLVAAFEIGKSVVTRLAGAPAALRITPLTIALMASTFVINLGVTLYETRAGRRLQSDVLIADAQHTRTDLFVTVSVIASLIGAEFGLTWLDPLVAGAVVLLLVRASFDIFRSTSLVLTDVAVADRRQVEKIALGVPGVRQVDTVRSRGRSDAVYVDLHVQVNPDMDTDQAHGVASEVERRINSAVPGVVDTVVHVEPLGVDAPHRPWEALALKLRGLADGMGIAMHDLHAHVEREGGYALEAHVEVDSALTLGGAHALVDEFERRVLAEVPGVQSFVTHLEPLPAVLADEAGEVARTAALRLRVVELADSVAGRGAAHHVVIHNLGGFLTATLDVTLPAALPLVEAHAVAEKIERTLHSHEHRLRRVVVHVEPPE